MMDDSPIIKALVLLVASLGCFGVTRACLIEIHGVLRRGHTPFSPKAVWVGFMGVVGVLGVIGGTWGLWEVVKIFWGKL